VKEAAEKRRIRLKQSCEQEPTEQRVCPIHREPLKPDAVEIVDGDVSFPPEQITAWRHLFPNSNKVVYGDSVGGKEEFACVWYCSTCREAESRWEPSNKRPEKPRL